jgi:hypothetical protein
MNRAAAALLIGVLLSLSCALLPATAAHAAGEFDDWAAVVVAGDFRAHSGSPTESFDNARRDVAQALVQAGFAPGNIRQFSVRPERYPQEHLMLSDPGLIASQLAGLASAARGGCLVYFTSHGSPDGVLVGERLLSPPGLSAIMDDACPDRPAVVIISACFSGVFVPPLSRPDRVVLTAARPDRTSFGCGESDRYPYFDACMLQELPLGGDFGRLGAAVQHCVARKEAATGMSPPSEPQLFIGSQFRPMLPFYALRRVSAPAAPPRTTGAP